MRSFGVPALRSGTDASKFAGQAGSLYIATDTRRMYRDNGTSFDPIGGAYIVSASVPTDVWEGLMWPIQLIILLNYIHLVLGIHLEPLMDKVVNYGNIMD